jgi:hypothetical protein
LEILNDIMTVVGAATLAAIAWFLWRMWRSGTDEARQFDRRERRERGLCPECGYDVRASGGRCPECGAAIRDLPEEQPDCSLDGTRLDPRKLSSDWPAQAIEPEPPGPAEELVLLHSTRLGAQAELLQQQLMARGVWCRVEQREEYTRGGAVVMRVRLMSVLVPARDRERAEQIMQRFRLRGPA